jgi:N-acetylmuramic acid 6-phosphate etherase
MDINKISTEKRNNKTKNIDILSTREILELINEEDKSIANAVEKSIDSISDVVDLVTQAFQHGGRLFYIGAGTSGRLGVLDASECPPTFGVDAEMVVGIIAGGDHALRVAVEGVEDSFEAAVEDLKSHDLNEKDVVVGIAASGRTPYVIGGLKYANSIGCDTACLTTSENSEIAQIVKYPIEAITGPEPLTGSTRMKSGTAQKMILNMITTTAMVKIGKVYENLMIDVQMNNKKLVSRAQGIVMDVTGVKLDVAKKYLEKYGSVKYAIFAILSKIEDYAQIKKILDSHDGNIRESLKTNAK